MGRFCARLFCLAFLLLAGAFLAGCDNGPPRADDFDLQPAIEVPQSLTITVAGDEGGSTDFTVQYQGFNEHPEVTASSEALTLERLSQTGTPEAGEQQWRVAYAGFVDSATEEVLTVRASSGEGTIERQIALTLEGSDGPPGARSYYVGTSMYFAGYLEDVCGITYRGEDGEPKDPYASVKDRGGNIIRLALHRPPFSNEFTEGEPPADWGRFARVKSAMQRADDEGLETFLTIAYNTYELPAEERNITGPPTWNAGEATTEALADSMYNYTYRRLDQLAQDGLVPSFVAIGNEINGGFLGRAYGSAQKVRLLNAGAQAVRDVAAAYGEDIRVVMHIFSPDKMNAWLADHTRHGLDFDVLGLSYYRQYHDLGAFADLGEAAAFVQDRYDKDFLLLETAQLFTDGAADDHGNVLNAAGNVPPGYPVPPTTETQRRYLEDRTREIVDAGGLGTIVWGGDWVGSDCYIYPSEFGPGSSWENNAFWNFDDEVHSGIDWMNAEY